ncbi:MAG: enolase C-terminal domain-like protein [Actinomycetes bacterium]
MTTKTIKATIKSIQTLKVDPIVHPSLVVQGSSGVHDHSNFLIVRIILSSGIEGIGEVSGTLGWSGEDSGTAEHAIRTVLAPALIGQTISPVENLLSKMETALAASPFTKAGVATALWDAYARSLDITMADALGGAIRTEVPIKFSLSGDKARIKHVYEAATKMGFGAFKLKIGRDPIDDGDRFAYTRALVGADTFLGTDANTGYRRSEARLAVSIMREHNPAFLEQPVAAGDLQGMHEMKELGIPVIADESVFDLDDLVSVLRAEAADVISIYVGKSGGPSKAVEMGRIADAFGLDSLIGSNGESGVGAAAQLQVACAMPGLSMRFPSDIIGEFYYVDGILDKPLDSDGRSVRLPDGPGLGVGLRGDLIEKFR